MKQFTLILLMLGVALAGLISTAEARGMGRGVGNASCPAWSNASYTTGAAGGSGMRMMRGVGYGNGYAQGAGHGSGRGYGWMRGATAPAQAVPAAPAQSQQ